MPEFFSTLLPLQGDTLRTLEAKILLSLNGGGGSGGAVVGPTSAGNGPPTGATPGNLYVQWDSVPPNIIWAKNQDGSWS